MNNLIETDIFSGIDFDAVDLAAGNVECPICKDTHSVFGECATCGHLHRELV